MSDTPRDLDMNAEPASAKPGDRRFLPETLDSSVIAAPLLKAMKERARSATPEAPIRIIIDLNLRYPGGQKAAKDAVTKWARALDRTSVDELKGEFSPQYVFAQLTGAQIQEIVRRDKALSAARAKAVDRPRSPEATPNAVAPPERAIHRIWTDEKLDSFTYRTVSTVKADAARNVFDAVGRRIVWAVADTGIDRTHPHFAKHENLALPAPLQHRDFTQPGGSSDEERAAAETRALTDEGGHGTHVAGIIAGEFVAAEARENDPLRVIAASARTRDEAGDVKYQSVRIERISGMAPCAKLLSLKVLNAEGEGHASNLIAAIGYIQHLNGHGRNVAVHGLNMSVGYEFDPEWFACGQSPLCVEVDRLVRSGVVVVVAAGNTGYGYVQAQGMEGAKAGLDLTINDPGNAELAITVGSTHREAPHRYGVSYFSSKGPTGDGRLKPDLVAPGEKIISCMSKDDPDFEERRRAAAAGGLSADVTVSHYKESSGTSMAAPHVSGVIAAFLSIRDEFIGRPEVVKALFLDCATDLKRDRHFQGHGLIDLMRALQSV